MSKPEQQAKETASASQNRERWSGLDPDGSPARNHKPPSRKLTAEETAFIEKEMPELSPAKPAHSKGETLQECLDQKKGGPANPAPIVAKAPPGKHTPEHYDALSREEYTNLTIELDETAAERDRLRANNETIAHVAHQRLSDLLEAREQVKMLLAACKAMFTRLEYRHKQGVFNPKDDAALELGQAAIKSVEREQAK